MKKKTEQIPVSAIESVIKDQFKQECVVYWHDIYITVRKNLSMKEAIQFTKDIVESCFLENGVYVPEVFEFVVKRGILTMYANFKMPKDIEKQYDIVFASDAVGIVMDNINVDQLDGIVKAANKKIALMCNSDVVSMRNKMNSVFEKMEVFIEKSSEMFDGISSENISGLMSAVNNIGKMDNESIINILSKSSSKAGDSVDK